MQYVKATFTFAGGFYTKTVVDAKVVEKSDEYTVFTVSSMRSRIPTESLGVLGVGIFASDFDALQRVVYCNKEDVENYEQNFLNAAEKHFGKVEDIAKSSLAEIQKRKKDQVCTTK